MTEVFISYSSEDEVPACKVQALLTDYGHISVLTGQKFFSRNKYEFRA